MTRLNAVKSYLYPGSYSNCSLTHEGQGIIPMQNKMIAIMTVLALAFAGFGAVLFTEPTEAADAGDGDLIVIIDGKYIADEDTIAVIAAIGGAVYYTTALDEDFEEKITVLTKDYYDAMKEAGLIKGMTVTFTAEALDNDDIVEGLKIFTAVEMNKLGEIIGGVDTKLVIDNDVLTKDVTYEVVDADDATAAIIIAVAAAVAEVEAEFEGYLSPEEVEEAIDAAVAEVEAEFEGYVSPADAKKMADDAVAEYIAQHPVKEDGAQMWMIIAIFAIVAAVALGGFTGFKMYKESKKAKQETA